MGQAPHAAKAIGIGMDMRDERDRVKRVKAIKKSIRTAGGITLAVQLSIGASTRHKQTSVGASLAAVLRPAAKPLTQLFQPSPLVLADRHHR